MCLAHSYYQSNDKKMLHNRHCNKRFVLKKLRENPEMYKTKGKKSWRICLFSLNLFIDNLVEEFAARIRAEELSTHFWQHLTGDHLQPILQRIIDANATMEGRQFHSTASVIKESSI